MKTDEEIKAEEEAAEKAKAEEADKPLSLYDKTEAIVARQEAANKEAKEILDRQEKLHANQRLTGTSGGHVETPKLSEEQTKTNNAAEFFKGTALGDAIIKTNE